MDWGGANSRFLGLVSVWAARSFDQTALRPSVIKRIRQIDVKYITHITSFGVTAWTRVTAWTCMCELPRCTVHWTRISIHWILDFKQLLLLLLNRLKDVRFWIWYSIQIYNNFYISWLCPLRCFVITVDRMGVKPFTSLRILSLSFKIDKIKSSTN